MQWNGERTSSVPLYVSSSIVFTPRSLFLLFVLLFSRLIVEDRAEDLIRTKYEQRRNKGD